MFVFKTLGKLSFCFLIRVRAILLLVEPFQGKGPRKKDLAQMNKSSQQISSCEGRGGGVIGLGRNHYRLINGYVVRQTSQGK